MEVDMQTPSFTISRQMKRSRSPDSPTERPVKRLSLAVANDYPSSQLCFAAGLSTMMFSSSPPDSQARGWRIESTQIAQPPREDDMVMDCDSHRPICNPRETQQLLTPPPDHTPSPPHRNTQHPGRTPPMPIDPIPPPAPVTAPNSTKRPKFTMGPRGDCEKCRLGVKGHWMHFD